ncbi:uncharacterized protein BP01DRAFT_355582 [Aspergillus saccharolyticus JOP 1030-1]|uniref:Uncharacterized protein n=1 Tax=Aspergillus saccharolyticus JOP 1030-1 TaxID=1450539 RepID=A0A318ZII1_9EURO|nr:hypothetical protein BP01DRAFT_355582 [Aspergillus saccharolyticus JOP 1030-1]PYH46587.1 hypothetical protein BP01DRAFT_355582 [Aspergillus saccharolyticus JOP 1030-1]
MYDSPTFDGLKTIPNTPCNTLQADGSGQSDQTKTDSREATPYDTISSLASEITPTNNTGSFIMHSGGRTIVAEQDNKILILEYEWLGTNEEVDFSRNETCLTVEGHKFVARLKWSFVVPIELHTPKRCASVMTDTDEPLVEDEQRKKRRIT